MIAMQYSFVLPADYDMAIIERRIRDKGPMLDGFPNLRFKAYLSARKLDDGFQSAENLYAPFYLWKSAEGVTGFLTHPGFAGLTRDLGWPSVRTWVPLFVEAGGALASARFASRDVTPIAAFSDLAALRAEAAAEGNAALAGGALAAFTGFDPTVWSLVRFRLWERSPQVAGQIYRVGHVSLPSPSEISAA